MKTANFVYDYIGVDDTVEVVSCSELNRMTLDYVLTLASPAALDRMMTRGRTLSFGPDNEYSWGVGIWEGSNLQWKQIDDNNVELVASRLWSNPDFPIYPGELYCDLLSPYRALEWIYIESIRHKMQF